MNAHNTVQFVLDDFTQPPLPPPDVRQPWDEPKTYYCEAITQQVKAVMHFRWYSGDSPAPRGYLMDLFTGRVNEGRGNQGRKQFEQAKALFPVLEEKVRSALLAAGWRVIGRTRMNDKDVWWPFGEAILELEARLQHLARRIWRGPYPRQGMIKYAPLSDEELLQIIPAGQWTSVGTDLEASVDRQHKQIQVRRQWKAGSPQQLQQVAKSQSVAVIGDEQARARGAAPAFQRTRTTRAITFTCAWCTQMVVQQRYPSPKPMYCSDTCEQEAQREKTRIRVQRLREKRRNATRKTEE